MHRTNVKTVRAIARGGRLEGTLFAASVANLKPASALALDDDLAVPLAQFDLANVTTRGCYEAGPKII